MAAERPYPEGIRAFCRHSAGFARAQARRRGARRAGSGQTRRYLVIAIFAAIALSTMPSASRIGGTTSDCCTVM
ncbi:hypothetical protein GCM10009768_15480 [Leucobacter iarius]|uniref:Uncharacterized protein n=1 Tax=Leucobacter iarius TaxID=333963 RepID=A0ABN2LGE4_9MICO